MTYYKLQKFFTHASLSILLEKQGRSQAAPLAAGRCQGELGAASVRYHNLYAECLGILTFWKRNWKNQADIPAQLFFNGFTLNEQRNAVL